MMALSSVLCLPIFSLHPETGGVAASQLSVRIFNGVVSPKSKHVTDQ